MITHPDTGRLVQPNAALRHFREERTDLGTVALAAPVHIYCQVGKSNANEYAESVARSHTRANGPHQYLENEHVQRGF
jgi:hypothetical protein